MAGPGRPRVGERIAVRLPDALLCAIDDLARSTGRSRAETVRDLLAEAVPTPQAHGVDVAQLRAQLRRTPIERVRHNTVAVNRLQRMRGAALR